MAIHIERITIGHFRGIHNLDIDRLNHLNIIAGDNNSGKTSVLEAIMLLRNPSDFDNILRLARMRDTGSFYRVTPVYESFINLFSRDASNKEIGLVAVCNGEKVEYKLLGEQKRIMTNPADLMKDLSPVQRKRMMLEIDAALVEVDAFSGVLTYDVKGNKKSLDVELAANTPILGREAKSSSYLNVFYLSPTDHVRGRVLDRILRNDGYKEICLQILRLFDSEIVDFLILRDEESFRSTEYIKHTRLGTMPLSTYGDGLKKVLSLANAIAYATGGVLLIDEVETAIHSKLYEDIFKFLAKASKQFDVQVFITTHSIEAIDGLLATQDYEQQEQHDDISVITFKKEDTAMKTYSRVLTGRHVYANRAQFGFDVRL